MAYKNGDAVFAEDINKAIDDSAAAVIAAATANTKSDSAVHTADSALEQVIKGQGTKVYVNNVLKAEVRVFRQEGKPGDAEWGVGDIWERIVGRVE